jgi:hypothetical protein
MSMHKRRRLRRVESNKVKLPKEVAEAIEHALKLPAYPTIQHLMSAHARAVETDELWGAECEPLNKVGLFEMADILRFGYEVEQTPEDKVVEYFKQLHDADAFTEGERKRHKKILTHTLDLLNIKITGVNDHE